MNIKKVKNSIEELKNDLDDALIMTDIYTSADGESIAGYNTQPKACALFSKVTNFIFQGLKESNFPELCNFYIVNLVNNFILIVLPLEEYQCIMLIDSNKAPLGLLLNIILPKMVESFKEATKE
jgi:hypothetical protein